MGGKGERKKRVKRVREREGWRRGGRKKSKKKKRVVLEIKLEKKR